MPFVGAILNANAKKNRRQPELAARLRDLLGPRGHVLVTRSLDELRPAILELLGDGAGVLLSAGGDGALHQMQNVLLDLRDEGRLAELPPLLPTNGGTIDFVARKTGIRGDAVTIARRLLSELEAGRRPEVTAVPSLELQVETADERRRRVGFALAAGGVGQRFFEQYYALDDPGPLDIVRVVANVTASLTARTLGVRTSPAVARHSEAIFEPTPARVFIDGEQVRATRHSALHAGAFDVNLGGVFKVFPLAADEGRLHFHAGESRPWEIIAQIPRLATGRLLSAEGLEERAGAEMIIEATERPLSPVIDGEIYEGVTRLEVRQGEPVSIARP